MLQELQTSPCRCNVVTLVTLYCLRRRRVVFHQNRAFIAAGHGSPKAQNIENAVAHTQSGKPLACPAPKQMPAVWQHCRLAHRMSIVRLLPYATGVDARRQVIVLAVRGSREF